MDGEERAIEVDSDWVEELAVEEDDSQAEDSVSCHIVCCSEQHTVLWRIDLRIRSCILFEKACDELDFYFSV